MQVLSNSNRDPKKHPHPYELHDVKLPTPHEMRVEQQRRREAERLLGKVESLNKVFGGKDNRKGG